MELGPWAKSQPKIGNKLNRGMELGSLRAVAGTLPVFQRRLSLGAQTLIPEQLIGFAGQF